MAAGTAKLRKGGSETCEAERYLGGVVDVETTAKCRCSESHTTEQHL